MNQDDIAYARKFEDFLFVAGGTERYLSLLNALKEVHSEYVLVSDIARCCLDIEAITRLIDARGSSDCLTLYTNAVDSVVLDETMVDRDLIKLIQTPQLSKTQMLKRALVESSITITDDSGAIKSIGGSVGYIKGSHKQLKLTHAKDLEKIDCLKAPPSITFSGVGYDIHPFEADKKMVLCGVELDTNYGFKAHSDGDVAIHSLIDALLGATGMGDIGELFPDTDAQYKGADSKELLAHVVTLVRARGYEIVNVDVSIVAEQPRLKEYKAQMAKRIASLLGIGTQFVNIKATTNEKLDAIGEKKGVGVYSIANVTYYNTR